MQLAFNCCQNGQSEILTPAGIPNTAHFANVTQIEDAMSLWEKLKVQKQEEAWKPEMVRFLNPQFQFLKTGFLAYGYMKGFSVRMDIGINVIKDPNNFSIVE